MRAGEEVPSLTTTRRSGLVKNPDFTHKQDINHGNVIFLTHRKLDKTPVIILEPVINSEGTLGLSTHMAPMFDDADSLNERMLFEIKKATGTGGAIAYGEKFHLFHKFTGMYLSLKEGLSTTVMMMLSPLPTKLCEFFCEAVEDQESSHILEGNSLKICNNHLQTSKKHMKFLPSFSMLDDMVSFADEYDLFELNFYTSSVVNHALTRTSYVEIMDQHNRKKLKIVTMQEFLNSDLEEVTSYEGFMKLSNYKLTYTESTGTLWKVDVKTTNKEKLCGYIKVGDELTFECLNTGLLLSSNVLGHPNLILSEDRNQSTFFRADKYISKLDEDSCNEESIIWLETPMYLNNNKFILQEVVTSLGVKSIYLSNYEETIKCIQGLMYLPSNQRAEGTESFKDQIGCLGVRLNLYQQLYRHILRFKVQLDHEMLIDRELIFLHAIAVRAAYCRSFEGTPEDKLLCSILVLQFDSLSKMILEYLYVSVPRLDKSIFQKSQFYHIITLFLCCHKELVEVIFVFTASVSSSKYPYEFLTSRLCFSSWTDPAQAGYLHLLRKILPLPHIAPIDKSSLSKTVSMSLSYKDRRFFVDFQQLSKSILNCELDQQSLSTSTLLQLVYIGLYLNKISHEFIQTFAKEIIDVFENNNTSVPVRVLILSIVNHYMERKLTIHTPVCVKYCNINERSLAHQMFICTEHQKSLYEFSSCMDSVIDHLVRHIATQNQLSMTPLELVKVTKQLVVLLDYYLMIGKYSIFRLVGIIDATLTACEVLHGLEKSTFLSNLGQLEYHEQIHIGFMIKEVEDLFVIVLSHEKSLMDTWLIHPNTFTKFSSDLTEIKARSFKLAGIVTNQALFCALKELCLISNKNPKYLVSSSKHLQRQQFKKIAEIRSLVENLFELLPELEHEVDLSIVESNILVCFEALVYVLSTLNKGFKEEEFQLFQVQGIIRQNGIYHQLSELLITYQAVLQNVDWHEVILLLFHFVVGNTANARLLLPYKFEELKISDELDNLITEIFMSCPDPQEILRLERRVCLGSDMSHKIKYFKIMLAIANRLSEENSEVNLANKVLIFDMLLRIEDLEELISEFRKRFQQSQLTTLDDIDEQFLELYKVLSYLICQLVRKTLLVGFYLEKWFPLEEVLGFCSRTSTSHSWGIMKPYMYIIDTILDSQQAPRINQISTIILRNFAAQMHRNVASLMLYDDTSRKVSIWDILPECKSLFTRQFMDREDSSTTMASKKYLPDDCFWLFLCPTGDEIVRFGLLNMIKSLLWFHVYKKEVAEEIVRQIVELNVLFEGLLWLIEECEEMKLNHTFTSIKSVLKEVVQLVKVIDPQPPSYKCTINESSLESEELMEDMSMTSMNMLTHTMRQCKSQILNTTQHELRQIIKSQSALKWPNNEVLVERPSVIVPRFHLEEIPSSFKWRNIILYLDLSTLNDLHFVREFMNAYSLSIENNLTLEIEDFLFELSFKLKQTEQQNQGEAEESSEADRKEEYLLCKLQILKQILDILFLSRNQDRLKSDFEIFSLMIKNTFDFALHGECEWEILDQVISLCAIYMSCLEDPLPEIKLVEYTLDISKSNVERLRLVTRLFTISMEVEGPSAFKLLESPTIFRHHYLSIIRLCLKQDLSTPGSDTKVAFSMLQVVMEFNLFIIEKFSTVHYNPEYCSLLYQLKTKIVEQRLTHDMALVQRLLLTNNTSEQDFSVYLLTVLVVIENVCEMVVPKNQKYLFHIGDISFKEFEAKYLDKVEISYKGSNLTVCYPRVFNQQCKHIKDTTTAHITTLNKNSLCPLMIASEIIQDSNQIWRYNNSPSINFAKNNRTCFKMIQALLLLAVCLHLMFSSHRLLDMGSSNPVAITGLTISLVISVFNCCATLVSFRKERSLERRITKENQSLSLYNIGDLFCELIIGLVTLISLMYHFLAGWVLFLTIAEKLGLRIYDSIQSLHFRKLLFYTLGSLVCMLGFLQFVHPINSTDSFSLNILMEFLNSYELPGWNFNSNSMIKSYSYNVVVGIYLPGLFFSFMILWYISSMNERNTIQCLMCQKTFNKINFSQHSIHRLSNYVSYFSFILSRNKLLCNLSSHVKIHIDNHDLSIFPK